MRVIHIYYIYNLPSSMYGVTKANMWLFLLLLFFTC